MPLPPSLPPPSPPSSVDVERFLAGIQPPPMVETARIEAIARSEAETRSLTESLEEWARAAEQELRSFAARIRESGVSNLYEVLDQLDTAARGVARGAAALENSLPILRSAVQEIRKSAESLAAVAMRDRAGEAYALAASTDRSHELFGRQVEAYGRVLAAYDEALDLLIQRRDAEIVQSSAALTDEVLARFWDDPDDADL